MIADRDPSILVTSFEMNPSITKQELFSFEEAFDDKSKQEHSIDPSQDSKVCAENWLRQGAGRIRQPYNGYEPTLSGNKGNNCERNALEPFQHRSPKGLGNLMCPMFRSSNHREIGRKKVILSCPESPNSPSFRTLNSQKSILEMKGSRIGASTSHAVSMTLKSYNDSSDEEDVSFDSFQERRYQWFAPRPAHCVGDTIDGKFRGSDDNKVDGVMYAVFYDSML